MGFEIDAGLRLPAAYSGLEDGGATLTLTTSMQMGGMSHDLGAAFEPLLEGYEYRVWGGSGEKWTDLGVFVPGTDFSAAVDGVEEVLVTVEAAGAATSPSELVVVSGKAGETLAFGGLSVSSFTPAALTAHVTGDSVELQYTGLPELPAGFFYELWAVPSDDAGGAEGDAKSLAAVEGAGDGELLAEAVEWPAEYFLAVTIESEHGSEGRSGLTVYVAEHEDSGGGHQH